jgi:tRNA(His) 5'-end guanylyltransferase
MLFFDSRVFIIPDITEVYNYFTWRQQDCTRNSISMAASAYFSHKELDNMSSDKKTRNVI